ncbi:TRAP transporter large permease [Thermoanaerobacteraceae bacterium SP2]|nr:TRAP transporter large permease [Thermoanaerobacteraceae bacterium SP2]
MLVAILVLMLLLLLGFPFYIAILGSALYLQIFINQIPISGVFSGLMEGVMKIPLLAVPYFILAGCLMIYSSVGDKLAKAILPWFEGIRGGKALGTVLAMNVFGAITGSAPAATGSLGRVLLPSIKEDHGEKFAIGLIASTGSLATIMPPSVNMIVFGAATETSVGKLFMAGMIPACIVMVILGIYCWYSATKKGIHKKVDYRESAKYTIKALPVLLLPVIILGGIYTGIFTATESAAVSVVYTLFLIIMFGEFNLKNMKTATSDSLRLTGQIFILIAAAFVYSNAITLARIPQAIADMLAGVSPFLFLLGLNIVLLIAGMFIEPAAAVIIFAPLIAPAAVKLGIDLVHLGIIFASNLAIGMFTPPFGLNLFVLQGILKKPLHEISICVFPFLICYIVAILIITYIPQLSLWLPTYLSR